jgi:hypothetical protein
MNNSRDAPIGTVGVDIPINFQLTKDKNFNPRPCQGKASYHSEREQRKKIDEIEITKY